MKKYLLASSMAALLCCGSSFAYAQDHNNTDISQVMNGVQNALNSITVINNNNNVQQSAVNAANLINLDGMRLDDVTQTATGPQSASNSVSTTYGMWNDLVQEATNVANSLDLGDSYSSDVSTIVQEATGHQSATNTGLFNQSADTISQTATNAANLVSLDDVKETVNQDFSGAASQYATNNFNVQSSSPATDAHVNDLVQEATNVANSITADDIENSWYRPDLVQSAYGPQTAANNVTFGVGLNTIALDASSQSATNAANIVSIDDLNGTSSQLAALTQQASNAATYVGTSQNDYQNGEIVGFDQTGTNAANILTASSLPSFSHMTEVTQNATGSTLQSVSNSISGMGYLSNITQSATNVANSISMPTPPTVTQ